MIVVVVLMAYFLIRGEITVYPIRWLMLPVILIWLGLLGLGCGIIVSSLTTKYRDLSVLVSFGMHLWMYATPVVYPLSTLTNLPRSIQSFLYINPVTMPIELFRICLLGAGSWNTFSAIGSIIITAIVVIFGIIIFNRVERTFMDTV